jgi:hypothetical protein
VWVSIASLSSLFLFLGLFLILFFWRTLLQMQSKHRTSNIERRNNPAVIARYRIGIKIDKMIEGMQLKIKQAPNIEVSD